MLASGASNPAIAITNLSKAYLAFTANDGSGHDVRGAYYYQGNWEVEPGSFNVTPADDAGTGTGRPAVAAAGDGVGIVVWGEGGHIYTRRVWGVPPSGTGPSIAYEQADIPSLGGWNEVSASDPVIGSGGDSSYVSVAFNEVFANGSQQQSRVLMRRLRGGIYDILAQPDGLSTPGVEGADDPRLAAGEYGEGFVTSSREASNELVEMRLGNNGAPGGISQLDSLPNTAAPFAAPAPAGLHSDLIAWQESPPADSPQIRARFFDGTSFGPEQVLSSPAMGPTDAADGLLTDGDGAADAVAVWVQGSAGSRAIVAAQLYQPPGSFGALKRSRYARSVEPTLTWSASRELWGPLRYVVTVDGIQVGQTTRNLARAAHPAAPGTADPGTPHMAGDGDQPGGRGAQRQHRHGVRRHDRAQRPRQADREADAGLPDPHPDPRLGRRRNPSGRGFRDQVGPGAVGRRRSPPASSAGSKFHVYRKVGRYRVTVIVIDRAGNTTTVVENIRIKEPPKRRRSASMAIAEVWRRLVRACGACALAGSVCAALTFALPALAHAQGPVYVAQPPTKGAFYRDGQSGRYLLSGEWLSRPDFADLGQSAGWWRNVAATDGWSPVTMPNSYNADDLSSLSMSGYVGWYRKDFTLPTSGAFSRHVPSRFRHWILRFESVNYRATVWLNGRRLGTPRRRVPAVRVRSQGPASRCQPADRPRRQPPHAGDLPPGPGRRLVELRRHPRRRLPPDRTARRHLAGPGQAGADVSDVRGDDRGPGARAQRHRGATDGVADRYLRPRQARLRLGHDRPPRHLDRTGDGDRQASAAVVPRSPVPLQRHVHGLRREGPAARQLRHLQRHPDDRRHGAMVA